MPAQTVGNVHVNVPLSNLAVRYMPNLNGFIADEVLPRLPVNNESDSYYVYDQGPFFDTSVSDLVADRAAPRRVEYSATTAQYKTERRELAWDISDRERRNADTQLRLEETKQAGTLSLLYLRREARVAALLRKTTNGGQLTNGANAGTKWDNASATWQTIYGDVVAGITKLRQTIGAKPNTIIIPAAVAEGMGKSAFFSAQAGPLLTVNDPAASRIYTDYPFLPPVLWGMRVLVPGAIQGGAKEGQTQTYTDIWDEQVRMLYVTPGPSMDTPSVGYTFTSEALQTRQWRDEERRVDAYSVGFNVDERVIAPLAGYEINDCLT